VPNDNAVKVPRSTKAIAVLADRIIAGVVARLIAVGGEPVWLSIKHRIAVNQAAAGLYIVFETHQDYPKQFV
jgi:hypothetical protein